MKIPMTSILMACCENLATVENACEAGRGTAKGLSGKLHIACINDVATVPSATNHVISGDIVMEATKVFYAINFDKVGSSFKVEPQGEGQSKYYRTTVVIFIAGLSAALSNVFNSTIRGEFMVIAKDKNGGQRLIGADEDGCDVAVIEQTDDKAGIQLTITWDSPNLPYYYTGAITIE